MNLNLNSKNDFFVLCVYKHPDMKNSQFLKELIEFIQQNVPYSIEIESQISQTSTVSSQSSNRIENLRNMDNLIILGDFNLDFNQKENRMALMKSFGFVPLFVQKTTHNMGNHLDWVFKNNNFRNKIEANLYETWYSDHSALYSNVCF